MKMTLVRVFLRGSKGGNPAPVVQGAEHLSAEQMQQVAADYRLETVFVLPPSDPSKADFHFRLFVPNHEMEMCGHATLGALWLLNKQGHVKGNKPIPIKTKSGLIDGEFEPGTDLPRISQPKGHIEALPTSSKSNEALIQDVLGISENHRLPLPSLNASTSRVKTGIPLKSPEILHNLNPDFRKIRALCETLNSTGLYPFALDPREKRVIYARQFPRSSGYPEDAATGIAATALFYALLHYGLIEEDRAPIRVRQGDAMAAPSEMIVRPIGDSRKGAKGCWLSGKISKM